MPDDGTDSEQSRGHFKALADPKWREMLFTRAMKADKGTSKVAKKEIQPQTDVDDFLGRRNSPGGRLIGVHTESIPRKPVLARIATGGVSERAASRPSALQPSQSTPPKLQQKFRKGLHVSFTNAVPEIIGEGGDDADLPSREVSKVSRSTAEGPFLRSGRPPIISNEANRVTEHDQGESDGSTLSDPSIQRTSAILERTSPTISSSILPVLEDNLMILPTTAIPTQSEAIVSSNHGNMNASTLPPVDSKGPSRHRESDMWKRKPAPAVRSFDQQNAVRLGQSQLIGNKANLLDSLDSLTHLQVLQQKEIAVADKREIAVLLVPGTPGYPADAYTELLSPFPDDQQHTSLLQRQEKDPKGSPPDVESNEYLLNDFYNRVQHLSNVFRLAADKSQYKAAYSLFDWVRACIWWLLKGRGGIEMASRSKVPHISEGNIHPELKQAYVNLAKAWWITKEIISGYTGPEEDPRKASQRINTPGYSASDHAQIQNEYDSIITEMLALTAFMKNNRLLPLHSLLIQGTDTSIWIQYPKLAPGLANLVTASSPRTLVKQSGSMLDDFLTIPLADTKLHFSYGRMFTEIAIPSEDGISADLLFPCILSIIRKRTDPRMEITIISQDGQVSLHVQSNKQMDPIWANVQWKTKSYSMRVGLGRGLEVVVRLGERDFKSLWGIHDYTRRVEIDWKAKENEDVVFEDIAKVVQYVSHSKEPGTFPNFPIKQCKVRLLKSILSVSEGTGKRKLYHGHRLVILTPPEIKTLSSINWILGRKGPLLFSHLRGEDNAPALLLNTMDDDRSAVVITFHELSTREVLHALLNGTFVGQDEITSEKVMLQNFSVFPWLSGLASDHSRLSLGQGLQWRDLHVVKEVGDLENGKAVLSEHLRVCINCSYGTVVDRINLGTGELQMSLAGLTTVRLYRPAQNNLAISFAKNILPADATEMISQTLDAVSAAPSGRLYTFNSLPDLHRFQQLVTGFSVTFDGVASHFAISRRRMVVPIYKRLEAGLGRIQILRKEKVIQLIAFFDDFSLGRCMNFALRSIDRFESFARLGKFLVRIVDAKFALPKANKDTSGEFVCLDTLEYPGEHDDIIIGFDDEAERDRFGDALPAPLSQPSRLGSLRR